MSVQKLVSHLYCCEGDITGRLTLEPSDSVHIEAVRCISHLIPIYFMTSPHIEMNIAFPGVVSSIKIGNLGEQGARVFGVRVEENIVYNVVKKINAETSC
jgi:hypothetical protein